MCHALCQTLENQEWIRHRLSLQRPHKGAEEADRAGWRVLCRVTGTVQGKHRALWSPQEGETVSCKQLCLEPGGQGPEMGEPACMGGLLGTWSRRQAQVRAPEASKGKKDQVQRLWGGSLWWAAQPVQRWGDANSKAHIPLPHSRCLW